MSGSPGSAPASSCRGTLRWRSPPREPLSTGVTSPPDTPRYEWSFCLTACSSLAALRASEPVSVVGDAGSLKAVTISSGLMSSDVSAGSTAVTRCGTTRLTAATGTGGRISIRSRPASNELEIPSDTATASKWVNTMGSLEPRSTTARAINVEAAPNKNAAAKGRVQRETGLSGVMGSFARSLPHCRSDRPAFHSPRRLQSPRETPTALPYHRSRPLALEPSASVLWERGYPWFPLPRQTQTTRTPRPKIGCETRA